MTTDPFDKCGQQKIDTVYNTHHRVNTWTNWQCSLQQLVKSVDYVADSIVDTFLCRLLLCQLCTQQNTITATAATTDKQQSNLLSVYETITLYRAACHL